MKLNLVALQLNLEMYAKYLGQGLVHSEHSINKWEILLLLLLFSLLFEVEVVGPGKGKQEIEHNDI